MLVLQENWSSSHMIWNIDFNSVLTFSLFYLKRKKVKTWIPCLKQLTLLSPFQCLPIPYNWLLILVSVSTNPFEGACFQRIGAVGWKRCCFLLEAGWTVGVGLVPLATAARGPRFTDTTSLSLGWQTCHLSEQRLPPASGLRVCQWSRRF